jgi:hypothetical protein
MLPQRTRTASNNCTVSTGTISTALRRLSGGDGSYTIALIVGKIGIKYYKRGTKRCVRRQCVFELFTVNNQSLFITKDIMERANLPHMSPPTDAMECEEVSSPRIVLILRIDYLLRTHLCLCLC